MPTRLEVYDHLKQTDPIFKILEEAHDEARLIQDELRKLSDRVWELRVRITRAQSIYIDQHLPLEREV